MLLDCYYILICSPLLYYLIVNYLEGLTAKGFLVMLNKEADKTLLHSPLKLDCDRRKRTTISLTLSLNKHYNASVANWMWALIIYFPFFTTRMHFPFHTYFKDILKSPSNLSLCLRYSYHVLLIA